MVMPADDLTNAPATNAPAASMLEDEPADQSKVSTPPAAPVAGATAAPAAATPPADTHVPQDRARADFMQNTVNSGGASDVPAASPAQKKQLDDLLNQWQSGKITTDQYMSLRNKILSGSQ